MSTKEIKPQIRRDLQSENFHSEEHGKQLEDFEQKSDAFCLIFF